MWDTAIIRASQETGHGLGGCESGWAGDNCDDCDAAHFGPAYAEPCHACVHGTNSSGIHGTGACTKCEAPFTGLDCNVCHGTHDDPQCGTAYQPADCLDPINGAKIRTGCPSMCNACGPPPSPPGPPPPRGGTANLGPAQRDTYGCCRRRCCRITCPPPARNPAATHVRSARATRRPHSDSASNQNIILPLYLSLVRKLCQKV